MSDRISRGFNRSGATGAVVVDISKAFYRVWHGGLLDKLKSYGVSGQIFGLISLFLVFSLIDSFNLFWMGSLLKNIQLTLEFLKAPFLVLHFSYYTFLVMLSVIMLSMLMILPSILSVFRHLMCGNN